MTPSRLVITAVALAAAWLAVPVVADRRLNRVEGSAPEASERAKALHAELAVADLHADTLLWSRPLLKRNRRGHVDLPRLHQGGVAVQVFGLVTRAPRKIKARNDPRADAVGLIAAASGWPARTRRSLLERALYQARRLREQAAASGGRLALVGTSEELAAFLERRRTGPRAVAALLSVEGAQALEGRLENLDRLYDAGVRMMSPAHFSDTEIGGSAHGLEAGGLTPLGREWLGRMEARGMIVDVAHASPATIEDILSLATRPVVVSHTGVRGTCDNKRNLSDDQLRRIAGKGGLIGIGYWPFAVCGNDLASVARAIRHAVEVAGPAHVALGSDFDGAVASPIDASQLDRLTGALLDAGLEEEDVRRVMGANLVDFLSRNLP